MQDLKSLCQYYLRCIDTEQSLLYEISFNDVLHKVIEEKEIIESIIFDAYSNALEKYVKDISNNLKLQKQYTLHFGYPIFKSNSLNKYIPIFIFNIEEDNFILKIPILNASIVKYYFSKNDNESFIYDLINLQKYIGLDNDDEEFNFYNVLAKLKLATPLWNWSTGNDNSDDIICDQAIVFYKEKGESKYTQGLEKELAKLMNLKIDEYKQTALYKWLNNKFNTSNQEINFYDVFDSNDEQKNAVIKALTSDLSVVSGPPGTGKSQVVCNILINAIMNNKSVLFSSKNHKAVDVVVDRINSLSKYPAVIKFGGWKNSFTRICEYVENLLSKEVKEEDKILYQNLIKYYNELIFQIQELNKKRESIIASRNKIDSYERSISHIDDHLRKLMFSNSKQDINLDIQNLEKINQIKVYLDKNSQGFIIKLFWKKILPRRLNKVYDFVKRCELIIKKYITDYEIQVETKEDILNAIGGISSRIKILINDINSCLAYKKLLDQLIRLGDISSYDKKIADLRHKLSKITRQLWITRQQILPTTWSNYDRERMAELLSMLKMSSEGADWKIIKKIENYLKSCFSCWAITSLSISSNVNFLPAIYDIVVIDEASQCDIASFLPLLFRAKSVVIIGDVKQLRHISEISITTDKNLLSQYNIEYKWNYSRNSLYDLALMMCPHGCFTKLLEHYRSHADIIEFSNKEFYEGELMVATKYENLKPLNKDGIGIRFINVVGNCMRPFTGSLINKDEADKIIEYVKIIETQGYDGSIGIVTPFRAQADYINECLAKDPDFFIKLRTKGFLCDTVHKFQGDEKDIILFSPVLSNNAPESAKNFIKATANLFNVAITRARSELIVIGDKQELYNSDIPFIVRFIEYINKLNNKVQIYDKLNKPINEFQSDWELILCNALMKEGINSIPQYRVDKYVLDIAIIKDNRKLDIEVDGELYHKDWNGELSRRDQLRNFRLLELGWEIKRFWVYQIRDMLSSCVDEIKKWYYAN